MENKCYYCGSELQSRDVCDFKVYCECPVCGRYIFDADAFGIYPEIPKDGDMTSAYLYHNAKRKTNDPYEAYFPANYIGRNVGFRTISEKNPKLQHVTNDLVENWFPKTFNDKINQIVLALAGKSIFFGARIVLTKEETISCMFVRRRGNDCKTQLSDQAIQTQIAFITNYLKDTGLIDKSAFGLDGSFACELSSLGWQRVDELQKHQAKTSKTAFVAMSFAKGTEAIRDAIKKAIEECGFIPRIMDEIEHNRQIVPEMLYEIRQARFVIAELTGHNNGAYYEAGYALGLGKEVIHVCSNGELGSKLHFDVKQINSVVWETEEDIKDKLVKRIKATIE